MNYSNSQIGLADLVCDKPSALKRELEPRCTSESCCRYKDSRGKWKFEAYVKLDVKKSAIDCPKCQHIIYWHNPALDDMNEIIDGEVG